MKHRKPNWLRMSALAAAMALPGAGLAAQFSADFFSAKGWVAPGEEYPFTLAYDSEGNPGLGSVSVTLPSEASFVSASAPYSQAGQTITFSNLAGAGEIIVRARADDLTQDPTIIWKNLSTSATYTIGTETLNATTLGPKVTTLESARYGKRPFPLVMVEYQDIHHCTGADERGGVSPDPFLECTANHSAEALDEAVNSRTSGRSLWQLFQDMSFGQLSPEGQVGPIPGTVDTGYDPTYPFKFSTAQPNGVCTGTTFANPATGGKGAPLPTAGNRIVDGWYRLPGDQRYYGSDSTGHGAAGALTGVGLLFGIDDACGPTAKLTYDAAAIADPELDYNEFDTDKDGVVDFFNVAFAGEGGNGNVGTGVNNVWPHKSDLQYYFTDENGEQGYVSNDQLKSHTGEPMYWTDSGRNTMTTTDTGIPVMVRVGPYNVNPEAAIEKMSVIAHEYGHSLGLPDFYSTGSRETFGSWELMASDHSQFMTVFTRQEMGWIVPRDAADGSYTLRESKIDTGEIHWKTPDGTPYTLTGPGIHNADALKFPQPTIKLIDEVPSGVRAWHSGSGNDFGCPTTQGHNLDFFVPEMAQLSGQSVELSFNSLYEIEWDWDYAFLMVSTNGGNTWEALHSLEGTTLEGYNPNQAGCYTELENAITGSSRVDPTERNSQPGAPNVPASAANRAQGTLQPAQWINDRFDLSSYAGNPGGIIIRFGYFTDPAVANRGWFIDDINLSANGQTIYSSDFEDDEHTRIFPDEWTRVSSADGVEADHAYYVEVRDRVSWDFDGKQQSDRGDPTWEPGVAILYTDESHGYGNTGVDNPPAQTIVDSQPVPEDDTPDLNDAAFTAASGDNMFDGCTHVDNYDTPDGVWKMPSGARVIVDSVSGLSGNGIATGNAQAEITVEANPACELNISAPVLAFGAGHSDPDPDGSYELTWVPTEGADGDNQLQEATNLSVLLSDNAENDMSNWVVSSAGGPVALPWSNSNPQSATATKVNDTFSFFTVADDDARNTSSIMTWSTDIAVPANGATILSFYDSFAGELDDQGFVEVSTDNGVKWTSVYTISNPVLVGLDGTFFDEPLVQKQVDLTPFAGENLQLRFRYFVGDANYIAYTPFGWWVDDVQIDTADWTDISVTSGDSYVRSGLSDGHYYYRVRSSHTGAVPVFTNWSNVIETDVVYVNQAPNAVDDAFTTYQGMTEIPLDVLANDSEPEGESLSITVVTQGSDGGFVELRSPTEIYYYPQPPQTYTGTETFTYTVEDSNGNDATATVTVTVEPNQAPVASDDFATVGYGNSVTIEVLANDSDPDGDTMTVIETGNQAQHGTVTLNPDNTITYTQTDPGPSVDDQFSYTISDGRGKTHFAYVHITVTSSNNAPSAFDDSGSTTTTTPVTIAVLANDTDADGDTLSVTAVTTPANGTATHDGNTVTYTANAGFIGTDTFQYTVGDGNGGSDTATVTVTVNDENAGNTDPVAVDDSATTTETNPVTIDVLANDSDADNDALSVASVTQGGNGSVVNNGDGTVTYTANAGFIGSDTFSYTVSDGNGGSDTATVTVTVEEQSQENTAPNAANDTAETDQDTAVNIDVLANDSDADGDSLSVISVGTPTNGTATHDGSSVTYTPNAGFTGSDFFSYTISDGNGGNATAAVSVTVLAEGANHAPRAKNDKAKTPKNRAISIQVLTNDKDPDGDPLTIFEWTQGANGSVFKGSETTLVYVPNTDFVGKDEFTYSISDGRGGADTAKVTVRVQKKDKDDDGSSDDNSSVDDGGSDDHSSDDGSSRDDGCSKDADCDGDTDSKDDDDDNDGIPDEQDDDIDGDGIPNVEESKGHDEPQGQSATVSANSMLTFPVDIEPATASLFVIIRGANTDMLQVEIIDSAGLVTGVSAIGLNDVSAFTSTFMIGEYSINVTNPTSQDIDIDFTAVRQQF